MRRLTLFALCLFALGVTTPAGASPIVLSSVNPSWALCARLDAFTANTQVTESVYGLAGDCGPSTGFAYLFDFETADQLDNVSVSFPTSPDSTLVSIVPAGETIVPAAAGVSGDTATVFSASDGFGVLFRNETTMAGVEAPEPFTNVLATITDQCVVTSVTRCLPFEPTTPQTTTAMFEAPDPAAPVSPAPEPSTLALVLAGLLPFALRRRRGCQGTGR